MCSHRVNNKSRKNLVTRREAVKSLALLSAGLSLACTPLRIVMGDYPQEFNDDTKRVDRLLRAFVETVVPGAPIDHDRLTAAFYDPYYRLSKYRKYFTADLCRRAERRCGTDAFEYMPTEWRTIVVRDGLSAGGVTMRLYAGAVFLAQIVVYSGLYNNSACSLIGFPGQYHDRGLAATTYPTPQRFLARSTTANGNPA